jgi:hypothetical protein
LPRSGTQLQIFMVKQLNSLTFCLITKGRKEYLQALLDSFNRLLAFENFSFHVILNGASAEVVESFYSWATKYPNKVIITTFQENRAGLAPFLPIITSVESDWICFPSDDDLLNETFFLKWEELVENLGDYGAVATSVDLIDSNGRSLGIRKKTSYRTNLSEIENAAKSFSECPFLWPGLIVRVKNIPQSVPSTRYVADWWIGMNLIFSSKIYVVSDSFTSYRTHESQESSVSSISRKNLEGLVHLGEFVTSEVFTDWIKCLEIYDVISFLELLIKYPPLYGDPKFSAEFVSRITNVIGSVRGESEVKKTAIFVNALAHEVLLHETQIEYIDDSINSKYGSQLEFNFNLSFHKLCCTKIKFMQSQFRGNFAHLPNVTVGCEHTEKTESLIRLMCSNLDSDSQIIDAISQLATEHFKDLDLFNAAVSQFEYSLLKKYRGIKRSIPARINRVIYRVFRN